MGLIRFLKLLWTAITNRLHLFWTKHICGTRVSSKGEYLLNYCYLIVTDKLKDGDENSSYEVALTELQNNLGFSRKKSASCYFTYLFHLLSKDRQGAVIKNFDFDPRIVVKILQGQMCQE